MEIVKKKEHRSQYGLQIGSESIDVIEIPLTGRLQ